MEDGGSSVTLVFYRVGAQWYREPLLNIVAAAAQMSTFTHCEIAIGEEPGERGMMKNVCRVFNDKVLATPLTSRVGRRRAGRVGWAWPWHHRHRLQRSSGFE